MPDLVLMIHGTFATAPADEGEAWWQRGSAAWSGLRRQLPRDVALIDEGPLFRWTGGNQEWAREQAAVQLLATLAQYETAGQGYHLIGHSHGGTVIWNALKASVRNKQPLAHLKSWATVGTPFFHFQPATSGVWQTIVGWAMLLAFVAAIFILPAFAVDPVYEQVRTGPWHVRVLIPLAVWFVSVLVMGTITVPFALVGRSLITVGKHVWNANAENEIAMQAMLTYRDRWLGLWSTEDEAICGLHQTVGFSAPILPELYLHHEVPFEKTTEPAEGPGIVAVWNVGPIRWLNATVVRWGNGVLCNVLARSLQGNNRPGMAVVRVAVGPLPEGGGWPSLPAEVDRAIVASANEAARASVPRIRAVLGQAMLGGEGVTQLAMLMSGAVSMEEEPVHTSYFENEDVLFLLALHIGECKSEGRGDLVPARRQIGLVEWYRRGRQSVAAGIN